MAGLVSYESSDEDEVLEQPQEQQKENGIISKTSHSTTTMTKDVSSQSQPPTESPQPPPAPSPAPFVGPLPQTDPSGPSLPEPEASPGPDPSSTFPLPPGSPHTAHRSLLRTLTLPTHPNLDLPPSPPGSPPPQLASKVTSFLALKDKGVHFNAKLESSSALRNPALMDKLLAFAGVDGPEAQYATTVSAAAWDPAGLPAWAFRSELRGAQEGLRREREAERRVTGRVDFVPASSPAIASVASSGKDGSSGLAKRRKLD